MTAKRKKATAQILELVSSLEKGSYNTGKWQKHLLGMSDPDFTKFMGNLRKDPDYNICIEEDNSNPQNKQSMSELLKIAKRFNIPIEEYLCLTHHGGKITPTPVPVLYLSVRALEQVGEEKNHNAVSTHDVNPITGQTTGHSKGSSVTDMECALLSAKGQVAALKELTGARGDNSVARSQMMEKILSKGTVELSDIQTKWNDQSGMAYIYAMAQQGGFHMIMPDTKELQEKSDEILNKYKEKHDPSFTSGGAPLPLE